MASPLTANFMAAFRKEQRDMATLVKVTLTDPSALTLYLGTREIATPGPVIWQMAIADVEPIHAPGSIRESSWSPATSGFTVLDVPLAHQTGGKRAMDVFHTHRWIGAFCTIYFWETGLTSAADLMPMAYQFMVQDYEPDGFKVNVRIIQDWTWNREVQLKRVTRQKYPRAPDASVGVAIPKVRGALRGVGLRDPWPNEYGQDQRLWMYASGGQLGLPGVVVDRGGGGVVPGDKARILFASHACKTFNDQDKGSIPFLFLDGKLVSLEPAGGDVFNAADGTGFKLGDVPSGGTDPFRIAYYPIVPDNVELVAANNAENPRAALDPYDETSYALIDYANNYRELRVRLPGVSDPGVFDSLGVMIAHEKLSGSYFGVRYGLLNTATGTSKEFTPAFPSPGFRQDYGVISTSWGAGNGMPDSPWAFNDCVIRVRFVTADAAKFRVMFLALFVYFRPKQEMLALGRRIEKWSPIMISRGPRAEPRPVPRVPILGPVPVDSPKFDAFSATLEGYADDGSGTYTGTASALIERAPDIGQHVLVVEGGLTTADLERGVGAFGSFVDARALLKTWRQSDMVHALALTTREERVSDALARLGEDAGIWVYRSEFDGKFKCIVWKAGVAVDYATKITARDIAAPGPRLRPTPGTRREAGVRVQYGKNYSTGRTIHECEVGGGRSVSGHKYRNLRDQLLTVYDSGDEQNDKLDFNLSAVDYTATLTAGDMTGIARAQDFKTQMNAAAASDWVAGYGPEVVAGFNDTIPVYDGASDTAATISASAYATMEDLATAAVSALSTHGWTASYSRITRKITLTRSSGTKTIRWSNASASLKRAMALLGFKKVDLSGTTAADYEREEERFHIGNLTTAFDLEWETGTNGTNGAGLNCAGLAGFDAARDSTSSGATDVSFIGVSPKNDREQLAAATISSAGQKLTVGIAGDTIYNHDTAREVRDRAADLLLVNRPEIEVPLLFMPDMERGRVIEFDSSLDELWPYAVEGSDGSWVGKKFRVFDKAQHAAGSYIMEIAAFEIS